MRYYEEKQYSFFDLKPNLDIILDTFWNSSDKHIKRIEVPSPFISLKLTKLFFMISPYKLDISNVFNIVAPHVVITNWVGDVLMSESNPNGPNDCFIIDNRLSQT